jgi:hypothetical protein
MSKARQIRSYEYVNRPYERVRDALLADTLGVFHSATRAAADRARSVASALRVNVAGLDVGTEIDISLGEVTEVPRAQGQTPSTRIGIEWEAARNPRLFPLMRAELSIYPLTAMETQLDFEGRYEPPLGAVGDAIDAVVGHRIAEASVHRFVVDVAHHLRDRLSDT